MYQSRLGGCENSTVFQFSAIGFTECGCLSVDCKYLSLHMRRRKQRLAFSAQVNFVIKFKREREEGPRECLEMSEIMLFPNLSYGVGLLVQNEKEIMMLIKLKHGPYDLMCHAGAASLCSFLFLIHRTLILALVRNIGEGVYLKECSALCTLLQKLKSLVREFQNKVILGGKLGRELLYQVHKEREKHTETQRKSKSHTEVLPSRRKRLKKLLEQEKAYQARKEKENAKRLNKLRDELVKLKSFALMLVDERQMHIEQLGLQSQKVQDLTQKLREEEEKLKAITSKSKEDRQKLLKLEVDFEHKASRFSQEHEEMNAKLANQESHNRQLRLKLVGLTQRIEELEETNKNLQKAEEELQELRDKIAKGECGNSSLMAEVENLRKRVLEMEGKDEEITKTESQCRELRKKLQEEEHHSRELKIEVEKLQKRMSELEKLEEAFSKSKSECTQLHLNLEKEKNLTKDLLNELEVVKSRVKELECSESRLEKAELSLKDDLTKLKSFTVMLVDERKNMMEKIKQEERKVDGLNKNFKVEQGKVMDVTEKLIEESKKLLKLKSEMEERVYNLTKERDELVGKLKSEEEKSSELSCSVDLLKKRLDGIEEVEREITRGRSRKGPELTCPEDNKIKELTLEIERLKKRLQQLEVVEGDLMKTEDEYDQLEQKFRTEQDKANFLSQQLEEIKHQIAKNKAIEKGEAVSQEAELRHRFRLEEAKSRDLKAEVQALKEKIHELMNKEDQLSQLQVDYSVLQQRFMEEENKNKNMGQEVLNLTKELELSKRYSRALRPSMNGRRMVDIPVTSTGVQTDAVSSEAAEEETPAVFIRKSFQEENHIMSNLRQVGLKKPMERSSVLDRYPPAANELSMRKSWIPWMRKRENGPSITPEKGPRTNSSPGHPENCVLQRAAGKPLGLRPEPDHEAVYPALDIWGLFSKVFIATLLLSPTLGSRGVSICIIPSNSFYREKSFSNLSGNRSSVSPSTLFIISYETTSIIGLAQTRQLASVSKRRTSSNLLKPQENLYHLEEQHSPKLRRFLKFRPKKPIIATPVRLHQRFINISVREDGMIHFNLREMILKGFWYSEKISNVYSVSFPRRTNFSTLLYINYPRNSLFSHYGACIYTNWITVWIIETPSTSISASFSKWQESSIIPQAGFIYFIKYMRMRKIIILPPVKQTLLRFLPEMQAQKMSNTGQKSLYLPTSLFVGVL
ncbi:hypothetical protein QTO34_001360 [Cnephaeus nilssonii]|uniref:Cortactin-binding protein-2 N-terminal domain-containing protein n=1 Tax=Cnephaeus nilssonii TaxID=3371016 RepID=A0AA40HVJ3_CNENI|nr:hypothetical protein QTO34_001360 [Eptesicus nilssonii]